MPQNRSVIIRTLRQLPRSVHRTQILTVFRALLVAIAAFVNVSDA